MQRTYQAVVVPQMFYGVDAWYSPTSRAVPETQLKQVVNIFVKIQRRAGILISGAFKSIAAAA